MAPYKMLHPLLFLSALIALSEQRSHTFRSPGPVERLLHLDQRLAGFEKRAKHTTHTKLAALFSDDARVKYPFDTPTATLRPMRYEIPLGGNVTLSCFVDGSDNWTILWYRAATYGSKDEPMTEYEGKKAINVSQGGIYHCRGRSDSGSITHQSNAAIIEDTLPITAILTLKPNWTKIYMGETFTVRCDIQGGEGTYWSYDWRPKRFTTYYTTNERTFYNVGWDDNGDYQCRGKTDLSFTQWSNVIPVTVSFKLHPVLTLSPSWLSPGASVTLNCEVEYPSEGWSFSWYKAVPYYKITEEPYTYELLPDGSKTAQSLYIITGQTSTAAYVCRAERGSNYYYTYYSDPKFVWSADASSAASLTVGPVVQNFGSDFVKLTCKGNSSSWRVRKFPENGRPYCSNFWLSGESVCTIDTTYSDDGVYWCESMLKEFSNAVNITLQDFYSGPLMVVPVDPVNEGTFVSLSCNLRRKKIFPNVAFYHNDKLVQNDSREELNFLAVSKSDEGFYKCQYSGKESPSRYMTVKSTVPPEIFSQSESSENSPLHPGSAAVYESANKNGRHWKWSVRRAVAAKQKRILL
ncbi:sialoadhesin isoform X1 [Maylandia zebra]|uniref:sialoadhesin isoform X1 n=1 Tax=Maylandia zebra TaxID=106582 RepID=UPI00403C4459